MRHAETRTVRQRIRRLPEEPPTADELTAIEEASGELSDGKSASLRELYRVLGHRRKQSGAKKSQARSRR
jgi:hypothetical protein